MIEHLVVGSAAYFHSRKRRLSQVAIDRLFRSVRAQVSSPAQNLFRLVRAPIGDALCPAICRSEEHTFELQSLIRNSYAVFCLQKNIVLVITILMSTFTHYTN